MNIDGVEYIEADRDQEARIKILEGALRSCRHTMLCRENEVGNRYGRASSDIVTIVSEALRT